MVKCKQNWTWLFMASALAALPSASASASSTATAYVWCVLYGQAEGGRNWQFYISAVGEMQSPTGEGWPDSPSDPIAKRWAAHLREQGVDVDQYAKPFPGNQPVCYAAKTAADAQGRRDGNLADVRKGSGGYAVHELEWAPSGNNE